MNHLEKLTSNGSRCELLQKCEINCIFLLLILRPNPQKISANLAKILEKYTWEDNSNDNLKGKIYINVS